MAVEKIQATDSLNTGRVKLNAAIDQSNEAITKATSAVVTANQAKNTADNVQAQFNQVVIEGDSSVEAAQARVDADGNVFTTLKERLDTKEQSFSAQLADNAEQVLANSLGIPLAPLTNVKITNNYNDALPLVFKNGYLWGFKNNTTIVRSNDDGKTWEDYATAPIGSVHSMLFTNDGEVLICNYDHIYKSNGWGTESVSWTIKVTKSSVNGNGIFPWGFDGDGQKFIATEYSGEDRSESRYVWISVDAGNTWNIVLDKFTIDPDNTSHMHGVCYDKWADRFWLSHGHGVIRGVYYSDDDGATWNKLGGSFQPDAAPTTLTATYNGIVCGSDSNDAGLYGIVRTEDPSQMEMKPIARWNIEEKGVTGFAFRGVLDEKTGQVFVSFKSDHPNVSSAIMAGTATTGSQLWNDSVKGGSRFVYLAVTDNKILGVISRDGVNNLISSYKPSFGVNTFDSGNIQKGFSRNITSIAIGDGVEVVTYNEIVIGRNAGILESSSGTNNIIIGNGAKASTRTVTIGTDAKSEQGDSIAIGNGVIVSGAYGVAIGNGASVPPNETSGIAIGRNAVSRLSGVAIGANATISAGATGSVSIGDGSNTSNGSVAIGQSAKAGTYQVAIGRNAMSTHVNSIALGNDVSTTRADQLNIGARHIEMKKVTEEPVSVPADSGRIFIKDDGTGKLQLCVRLGATTIVLATEP